MKTHLFFSACIAFFSASFEPLHGVPAATHSNPVFSRSQKTPQGDHSPVLPPIDLTIKEINDPFRKSDRIPVLMWKAPAAASPILYRIYRNPSLTKLAAEVSANGKLIFLDQNWHRHQNSTYFVVSVDPFGNESIPAVGSINE